MRATPVTLAETLSAGKWTRTRHIVHLSRRVMAQLAKPDGGRIMVMMPPRHGKSQYCSRWLPLWYLNEHPDRFVLLASYAAEFAAKWGRRVRDDAMAHHARLRFRVSPDSASAHRWDTTKDGGMLTVGVGGGATGSGTGLLLVDDPIKNMEEAQSQTYRERVWEWWQSVALTRLEPGGSVVMLLTRWNEDDLAGRILEHEADRWDVVQLPALAEPGDQLGRTPGEALWPERYPVAALQRIKDSVGSYVWSALFQQRPSPEGGAFFKRDHFRYWRPCLASQGDFELLPRDLPPRVVARSACVVFQTVDLAISQKETADWTVVATWALTPDRVLLLLDVDRVRAEATTHADLVKGAWQRHRSAFASVESVQYQMALVQVLRRDGVAVREFRPHGDKVARARTAQVYCETERVFLPEGAPFLDEFERELLAFPTGKHDDQVDTLSMAVIEVSVGNVGAWSQQLALELGGTRASPWRI